MSKALIFYWQRVLPPSQAEQRQFFSLLPISGWMTGIGILISALQMAVPDVTSHQNYLKLISQNGMEATVWIGPDRLDTGEDQGQIDQNFLCLNLGSVLSVSVLKAGAC